MIKYSIGSIFAERKSKDDYKFNGMRTLKTYGVVRDTREECEEELVNVEWYVDHLSKSTYDDGNYNYYPAKLYRTVVECGEMVEVEYLPLQNIFYQTNDGKRDFDMYHSEYCVEFNMMSCLLEERAENIYYVFTHLRMEICSMRRKRLNAYKEFVRMVHDTLGNGLRVEIPMCCVSVIPHEFPIESDGETAYIGVRPSTNK